LEIGVFLPDLLVFARFVSPLSRPEQGLLRSKSFCLFSSSKPCKRAFAQRLAQNAFAFHKPAQGLRTYHLLCLQFG